MSLRPSSDQANNEVYTSSSIQGEAANGLNQYEVIVRDGMTYTLSYTPAGSISQKTEVGGPTTYYSYDVENRLVQADMPGGDYVLFSYDPVGRRSQKTENTGGSTATRQFQYDGDQLVAQYTSNYGGGTHFEMVFTWGPGIDELINAYHIDEGWRFAHRNHQGSIVAISDSTGAIRQAYQYDEFGDEADGSICHANASNQSNRRAMPFGYTGQYLDCETKLYYYRARYYDPQLGRFLQTDPIGYEDQMNMYAYVHNDPMNFTDPSGKRVAAIYSNTPGVIFVRDQDTGKAVFSSARSGTIGNPNLSAGPIPPGAYSILERAGRPQWFRLERQDANFGDDRTPEGRSELRLHGPGRTIGCIACIGIDEISPLIEGTSSGTAQVDSGHWVLRALGLGGKETVKDFGTLSVLPRGAELNLNAETGAVTLTQTVTGTDSRLRRRVTTTVCTFDSEGNCN